MANILTCTWRALRTPSARWSVGALVVLGAIAGIVFWGGFNWAMELTNTETFCISCHEMRDNVFVEYQDTIHYNNRTGVRATCPDCHVPREWVHKVARKIRATNELFHWMLGSINTREKFEAHRLELATHVWKGMAATDSRECRNCHSFDYMDLTAQEFRARDKHEEAEREGKTCIDCHKGVAHELPQGAFEADTDSGQR
ncbi:MAG: NapC/NirT family cytochrome c [Gammaproteobacteria bacterium]|nr:NapC/NirT family cytochrome c [Gammaproteobacteria bacterium]